MFSFVNFYVVFINLPLAAVTPTWRATWGRVGRPLQSRACRRGCRRACVGAASWHSRSAPPALISHGGLDNSVEVADNLGRGVVPFRSRIGHQVVLPGNLLTSSLPGPSSFGLQPVSSSWLSGSSAEILGQGVGVVQPRPRTGDSGFWVTLGSCPNWRPIPRPLTLHLSACLAW